MKQKVLVIVGPTASGKSALAVRLARRFGGEIISADSRQVYRGLDLGTGKITKQEMRGIRHHLLDVASPKRTFAAQDFIRLGKQAVSDIAERGALPIVAGGTGFYADALAGRITLPDAPPNTRLRAFLGKKSATALYSLLRKKDPRRAKAIDPHNSRRLIRALEIAHALGKNPLPKSATLYDILWIGIAPDFSALEKRIAQRLDERLRRGMLAEAKRLRKNGLSLRRMKSLGLEYRALAEMLEGSTDRKRMRDDLYRDIRSYAKRQRTYWKRNKDIRWFTPKDAAAVERTVATWLSR